jgi:Fe2+ transport system protein FeoA
MLEMGLTPGTEIEILGTAPMGDPLEVLLRGYRLSLRRSEADLVEVDVLKRAGSV